MVTIRSADVTDLPRILAIYNDAVLNTTAIWNDTPADLESRRALLADRRARGYPFLVAEVSGSVAGYASFNDFRPFDGYRHTVEHSIYVAREHRGGGLGKLLLPALMEAARSAGKHAMIAGIDADNEISLRLHARFGFEKVGHLREVGTKFGRWLDLVFMQKLLT